MEQVIPKTKTQSSESSTPISHVDTRTIGGVKEAYKQEHDEEAVDDKEYTPPHNSHRQPEGKKCECPFPYTDTTIGLFEVL